MVKTSVRKNVFCGLCVISWVFSLVLFLTDKEAEDDVKKAWMNGIVLGIAACIPFVGVVAEVLIIITAIQTFKGNYTYQVPILEGLIKGFIK